MWWSHPFVCVLLIAWRVRLGMFFVWRSLLSSCGLYFACRHQHLYVRFVPLHKIFPNHCSLMCWLVWLAFPFLILCHLTKCLQLLPKVIYTFWNIILMKSVKEVCWVKFLNNMWTSLQLLTNKRTYITFT